MFIPPAKFFSARASSSDFMLFPLLMIGGVIAATGVGALTHVLFTSFPEPEEMVRAVITSSEPRLASSQSEEPVDWAPVFGSVQLEDVSSLDDESAEDATVTSVETDLVPGNYRLRGIIMEGNRGSALLESENGTEIIQIDGELSGGWKLAEVQQDGILIERLGRHTFIAFIQREPAALQSTYSFARIGEVNNGEAGQSLDEADAKEGQSLPRTLHTAYSRLPQLQPPRFFSTTN